MRMNRVGLCVLVFVLLGMLACGFSPSNPQPPARQFALKDLFIDESAFPNGWIRDANFDPACVAAPLDSGCNSIDDLSLSFWNQSDHAIEDIYVYESAERASGDFGRMRKSEYGGNNYSTPWITPSELPYVSAVASQSYFACDTFDHKPECQFLGQYDEFIVVFYAQRNLMSFEDIDRLLQAIDRRIADHLAK